MPGDAMLELLVKSKAFISPTGLQHVVLRDIDLTIATGQVVALLGRSGVGKSTLLRIALGLDRTFQGRLYTPPGRVGVMFQDPRLLPWLTVADNLRLVMPNRDATASRINDLLELAEIPGIANHLPSELSIGMARRVALARAFSVEPTLLVLDEPFASLDHQLSAALAEKVAIFARQTGSIVVIATHEIDHALAIADRICVLAGYPATLAINIAVPPKGDAYAIDTLRSELLDRFTFLRPDKN